MRGTACVVVVLVSVFAGCQGEPPGFDTPESALYDAEADCYLVSNIHGDPLAKDGNGYIARVEPDGGMKRHWIQGGHNGVTLHAPKGMALAGGVLWVADIDVLRKFDQHTGASLGEVVIPGATFLNDVSAAADGTVYVTDTGLDAKFAPTGTDAVWMVAADGKPVPLIRGAELGQPNGIVARDAAVYVVSWRDGTLYQVDRRGVRTDLGKAPTAQLDGLVRVEEAKDEAAAWYVSSWAGACIYRFDVTGTFTALPKRFEQAADLGFDPKRRRLLVPLFGKNELQMLPL